MPFNIRRIGRTYLWVCLVAIALIAFPVIKYVVIFALGLLAIPFLIIINVWKGNYGEALYEFLIATGVLFLIYKYFDRIIHALGWVYVVLGDLLKGQAQPGSARTELVQGGNTMSDDSLNRGVDRPRKLLEPTNLLSTVAQGIKARWSVKTIEEKTKVRRAQADYVLADNTLGQAILVHDDTAVELEPENRDKRCENKQADLDIKTMERQTVLMDAKKKFDEAKAANGKTPQQLEAEQFDRKRMYRSVDAQDEVFENFEFEATKNIELGRQYVKMRDKITNDPGLDKDVRCALLEKLKRQYETCLADKEGNGEARKKTHQHHADAFGKLNASVCPDRGRGTLSNDRL